MLVQITNNLVLGVVQIKSSAHSNVTMSDDL